MYRLLSVYWLQLIQIKITYVNFEVGIFYYICILRKYEHNNKKCKHGTFNKSKIREVAENSANTVEGKILSPRKGMSYRDEFRPFSRVSSGGRPSKETNWKSRTEVKDRFNQQQGT